MTHKINVTFGNTTIIIVKVCTSNTTYICYMYYIMPDCTKIFFKSTN